MWRWKASNSIDIIRTIYLKFSTLHLRNAQNTNDVGYLSFLLVLIFMRWNPFLARWFWVLCHNFQILRGGFDFHSLFAESSVVDFIFMPWLLNLAWWIWILCHNCVIFHGKFEFYDMIVVSSMVNLSFMTWLSFLSWWIWVLTYKADFCLISVTLIVVIASICK